MSARPAPDDAVVRRGLRRVRRMRIRWLIRRSWLLGRDQAIEIDTRAVDAQHQGASAGDIADDAHRGGVDDDALEGIEMHPEGVRDDGLDDICVADRHPDGVFAVLRRDLAIDPTHCRDAAGGHFGDRLVLEIVAGWEGRAGGRALYRAPQLLARQLLERATGPRAIAALPDPRVFVDGQRPAARERGGRLKGAGQRGGDHPAYGQIREAVGQPLGLLDPALVEFDPGEPTGQDAGRVRRRAAMTDQQQRGHEPKYDNGAVIVDQAKYVAGVRQPCADLSEELAALRSNGDQPDFLWIGLKDPTPQEFDLVRTELGLHPLAVEDVLKGDQRAKIERYEGVLFIVVKTLHYVEATSDVETGEIMCFVGDRFLLTIRYGEITELHQVRTRLEQEPKALAGGPQTALYAIIDRIVDGYLRVDEEVGRDLEEIEASVFDEADTVHSQTIYNLKREVLEVKRASVPLARALESTFGPNSPFIDVETRLRYRDVIDHLARVNDHSEAYDRLLTDVLHAHLARVGVRQNEDMRKISAWVAIAAMPTMIAGIYGMNFEHMPELGWRFGYPMALALMLVVCLILHRLFRKSGWL